MNTIKNLIDLRLSIKNTLEYKVPPIIQLCNICAFFIFETSLIHKILETSEIDTSKIYFSKDLVLSLSLILSGLVALFVFCKFKRIQNFESLFINTYLSSRLWTYIIFFGYTVITVPTMFYLKQNMFMDIEYIIKLIGFTMLHLLPFLLIIYLSNKYLKESFQVKNQP